MEVEAQYQPDRGTSVKKEPGSKPVTEHAIIPVSVLLAKKVRDGRLDNQEFQHLVLIARLVSRVGKGGKLKLTFSDCYANIEMTLNTDSDDSNNSYPGLDQGRWYFVAFTPRQAPEGQVKYFVDATRQITDFNEISKHISDVLVAHLERNHK